MPAIATPASSQPATNTGNERVLAMMTTAGTPRTAPMVMTGRGPKRSSQRPAGIPTSADTTRPAENAAVTEAIDQPLSAAMLGASTGNA